MIWLLLLAVGVGALLWIASRPGESRSAASAPSDDMSTGEAPGVTRGMFGDDPATSGYSSAESEAESEEDREWRESLRAYGYPSNWFK